MGEKEFMQPNPKQWGHGFYNDNCGDDTNEKTMYTKFLEFCEDKYRQLGNDLPVYMKHNDDRHTCSIQCDVDIKYSRIPFSVGV